MIGGAAVIVLLAGGLIFALSRKRRSRRAEDMSPAALAQGVPGGAAALDGKTQGDRHMEQQIADNDARQALLESEELNRIKLPESTRKTEVLVKHIRDSVQKDSMNATNVLRTWISDADTKRT
jgi:flagellar biosynthesis/type III secretory pathway M-ring protein FliF/YscJ